MIKLMKAKVYLIMAIGCISCTNTPPSWEKLDYYDGENAVFKNLEASGAHGLGGVLKWMWTRNKKDWPDWVQINQSRPAARFPDPDNTSAGSFVRITSINHSTFLVQVDGLNILTDPIYSERTSPVQWAGPKRVHHPGVKFEHLPPIDIVVISHDHYDHLDLPTLKRIEQTWSPLFLIGLGGKSLLTQEGLKNVIELGWWSSHSFEQKNRRAKLTFVPAQHFSGRGLIDRYKRLWGGFVIKTSHRQVYFAGDTGQASYFKSFPDRFGPIDIALIPIGAYEPRWFMAPVHVDPKQAVQIHIDVAARHSIGIHHGTFQLTDEARLEPVEELNKELNIKGLNNFTTLLPGEFFDY